MNSIIWALAWITAGLSLVNDWPWFWATFVLTWTFGMNRLPHALWWLWGGLVVLFAVEGLLRNYLPDPPVARSMKRLLTESLPLLWFSLLLGPVPGIVAWQGTVGFDAGIRLRGFLRDAKRRALIRSARLAVALAIVFLLPLGFR